jgi:hypothetical protein
LKLLYELQIFSVTNNSNSACFKYLELSKVLFRSVPQPELLHRPVHSLIIRIPHNRLFAVH